MQNRGSAKERTLKYMHQTIDLNQNLYLKVSMLKLQSPK